MGCSLDDFAYDELGRDPPTGGDQRRDSALVLSTAFGPATMRNVREHAVMPVHSRHPRTVADIGDPAQAPDPPEFSRRDAALTGEATGSNRVSLTSITPLVRQDLRQRPALLHSAALLVNCKSDNPSSRCRDQRF